MFSIFKKLFGKTESQTVVPTAAPIPLQPTAPVPSVEVAHLSLAAIVARFPEELQGTLLRTADPAATVALPLPTIIKQLPLASVKMSLASLHRQAPGMFQPLPAGDKRMIAIPLVEVFRHVRPHMYKRRADQRPLDLPENAISLFADTNNPHAVSPSAIIEETPEPEVAEVAPEPEKPRMLKMDAGLREHFSSTPPRSMLVAAPSSAKPGLKLDETPPASRGIAPPAEFSNGVSPDAAPANGGASDGPPLSLNLASLAGNWPEEIRSEVAALDPATTVDLPSSEVSAGLSKGRVVFSWGRIRACAQPQPSSPTAAPEDTELLLPLKIVAPAFLAASKQPANRKRVTVDASIPSLFNNGNAELIEELSVAPAVVFEEAPAAASAVPAEAPAERASKKLPETVGEVFGQPGKSEWTPTDIVSHLVRMPGVAGAIVTLQEGLSVATSMPDGIKSEVVAAFLPQIFSRLNQYAGEMKLGDVDDLLFTTHGAHCQIYRLGYVYFAALGKPGESLPWHELRIIAEELARQTQK